MGDNFCLSRKREYIKKGRSARKVIYFEKDVKEFIRRLKEEMFNERINKLDGEDNPYKIIDKLAGEKLTK